jgi:hypothetical protein
MVTRKPRRPGRHRPIPSHWWQPGVYGSVPAVALWILARMPVGLLLFVTGMPAAPAWLNQAGDTVFVAGWAASALLLWLTRRRPAADAPAPAAPAAAHASPDAAPESAQPG